MIEEFAASLPSHGAVAGLDFGDKTIGVAVSDTFRQVASPLLTIRRVKFTTDAEELLALVAPAQAALLDPETLSEVEHRLFRLSEAIARRYFLQGAEPLRASGLTLA